MNDSTDLPIELKVEKWYSLHERACDIQAAIHTLVATGRYPGAIDSLLTDLVDIVGQRTRALDSMEGITEEEALALAYKILVKDNGE